jgi:hypothetical protein
MSYFNELDDGTIKLMEVFVDRGIYGYKSNS